jgi:6-phosphogluconolactonase
MPTERFHLGTTEILVGEDLDEAIRIAAGQFAALARKSAAAKDLMTAALAGGNTPRRLYSALAAAPFAALVPWGGIHFFWGDERDVPPTHDDSNYHAANELMLSRVGVPAAHLHRIPTGDTTAIEAAELYQRTLASLVPVAHGLPRLDYCLLGLGADGHTASLFPGRPTLAEATRTVVADHTDDRGWRVSLSLPVINNAAQITFLVTGQAKAAIVARILQGESFEFEQYALPHNTQPPSEYAMKLPAQQVAPRDGQLTWILDAEAASLLQRLQ